MPINRKHLRRLYRQEKLNLRAKRPCRRVMAARRIERPIVFIPNEIWAMDSVSYDLFNGKRFRALSVFDAFTRECLAIRADKVFKGDQVVNVIDQLLLQRGAAPAKIRVDNGPEFIAGARPLAYRNQVTLDFSRPDKPAYNASLNPSTAGSATNA